MQFYVKNFKFAARIDILRQEIVSFKQKTGISTQKRCFLRQNKPFLSVKFFLGHLLQKTHFFGENFVQDLKNIV